VASLVDEVLAAGRHEIAWNGRDQAGRPLPSGVYLSRLTTAGVQETAKMMMLK
jgi:flagellar hook assembly protein FlgD